MLAADRAISAGGLVHFHVSSLARVAAAGSCEGAGNSHARAAAVEMRLQQLKPPRPGALNDTSAAMAVRVGVSHIVFSDH